VKFSLLTKTAFIFNMCFIAAILFRYFGIVADNSFKSTIVVSGYLLSFVFNAAAASWFVILLLRERNFGNVSNAWLATVNILFLMLQIFLLSR
jgi:hypothetical protein